MNTTWWIAQGLLSVVFLFSGIFKGTQSKERLLQAGQTGVARYGLPVIRFIAACEILGALGVTLPWLTGIAPVLTPVAAAGLGIIMVLAARVHAQQREPQNVATNLVLLAVCGSVAVVRFAEWAHAAA
jgi:uncharacterized membrane protein YphA (DoxX/SURF4 family)